MFLSPSTSQVMRDFIAQYSSSNFKTSESSVRNSCSSWTRKLLGLLERAIWTPLSLARIRFFQWNKFPNTFLFQTLSLSMNLETVCNKELGFVQASLTMYGKEGWESHIGLNLKGQPYLMPLALSQCILTRQWSEWPLSSCLTQDSRKRAFHSAFTKTRSILSWTSCIIGLLFDHV